MEREYQGRRQAGLGIQLQRALVALQAAALQDLRETFGQVADATADLGGAATLVPEVLIDPLALDQV